MKSEIGPDPPPHAAASRPAPVWLAVSGPDRCGEIDLAPGRTYRIGRVGSCDIVLRDGRISREHAMIQSSDLGEFYVIDLGSRNGTYRNGTRLTSPAALKDGDELLVGEHHITFRGPTAAPTPKDDTTVGTEVLLVRRMVTVLVADIRGYTAMSRHTDGEVLAKAVGSWFRDAARVLQAQGCWSVKYIGDAVMAVWLHDDDRRQPRQIVRVLDAAAQLVESTASIQQQFGLPAALEIGIGINTGIAIVGNAGTRTYTDYTAMGDCVNAAFRMESSTRLLGLQFVIGAATAGALAAFCDVAQFLSARTASLKGYEEPAAVWAGSLLQIQALLTALAPRIVTA
jgi:adenylate cyclase